MKDMREARDMAAAVALIALAILLVSLAWAAIEIPARIEAGLTGLRVETVAQANVTREAIVALLQPVAHQMSLLPDAVLGVADRRLGQTIAVADLAVTDADQRLGQAIEAADARLKEATGSLAAVAAIREDLRPAIAELAPTIAAARPAFANVGLMAGDTRAALAPMLECKGNAGCWPSEVTGIMGGSKTLLGEAALTARYWRKETPAMAANIREITGNGVAISKPHWYWKVAPIAAGLAVGIISAKVK